MPIDYKEYPANWLTEIRPAVLLRARNCCEGCKAPNGAIVLREGPGKKTWRHICAEEYDMIYTKVRWSGYTKNGAIKKLGFTKIVLTIAHLDHDKWNFSVELDRLRAWCQACHLGYDRPRHIENRKYGRNWKQNQLNLKYE